jgi:tryptophanyl-tRNA synthetase
MSLAANKRVLSGMRPTGQLHLGHYHGVLKNWLQLQHEFECFFFVADWHALTTNYEETGLIADSAFDIVVDWLSVGINPSAATIFVQSRVPEHAELHLLLSMITPLSWLERVPTYKDQQEKLSGRDLLTYGFLGYPLLQAADILIYKAGHVPVGEDQVAHIELSREIARRFNFIYGRELGFEEKALAAVRKLGKRTAALYQELRKRYQEEGLTEALERAQALLEGQQNISIGDRERLLGYLEGGGKIILAEPQAKLTAAPKMTGLDGRKMSKSYDNIIALREDVDDINRKIKTMPTDPARVRKSDPGNPEKCPVWQLHQIFTDTTTHDWVQKGCRSAGIGCLECKKPLIDAVVEELTPIREKAVNYVNNPDLVKFIIAEGSEKARDTARDTLQEVRQAMGLNYR